MDETLTTSTVSATKTTTSKSRGHSGLGLGEDKNVDLLRDYLRAFYLTTKIMTLVSEIPNPRSSRDYIYAIVQLVLALMLFATIMGHVGYIVTNLGNARKEFQCKYINSYRDLNRHTSRYMCLLGSLFMHRKIRLSA